MEELAPCDQRSWAGAESPLHESSVQSPTRASIRRYTIAETSSEVAGSATSRRSRSGITGNISPTMCVDHPAETHHSREAPASPKRPPTSTAGAVSCQRHRKRGAPDEHQHAGVTITGTEAGRPLTVNHSKDAGARSNRDRHVLALMRIEFREWTAR
jgi:hypothetical protein